MAAVLRLLAVIAAALGLGGSPASPHIPNGVRSIEIRSAVGITKVSSPADVRQIVKWFDALPRFQPRPCPYLLRMPPDVSFVFRDARGFALLRATDHAPGMCGSSVTYDNDGHVLYAPLADDGFAEKVSDLLRMSFDANATKTAANRRAAKREAARILHLLVLPPGSRRVAKAPSGALRTKGWACAGCGGGRHRFWKVPLPFESVVAFEHAHRPRGSHEFEPGTSSLGGVISVKDVDFAFPRRGGIASRGIWVNMAPLTDGSTGIRADPYAGSVVARASSESVPASVRTIEIRKGSRLTHRFTAPRKVAKIVRWFNALPLSPGGGYGICFGGYFHGPGETITFLDGSGHELARATAADYGSYTGECYPIGFSSGGHEYAALLGGNFLISVERLSR